MTNAKINEGEGVLEALMKNKFKNIPNDDVLLLYKDEEVYRLMRKIDELRKS